VAQVAEGFSVGVQIIRKLRQAEQMLNEGQAYPFRGRDAHRSNPPLIA
jgi:hypothetical protein